MSTLCNSQRKAVNMFSDTRKSLKRRILQFVSDMTSCIFFLFKREREKKEVEQNRKNHKNAV